MPPPLPPGRNPAATAKTMVEAAYLRLRRDIIEGRLRPGTRLRVEHLKDDYGVGSGTLREALSLLIADALVTSEGQRGFHVAPASLDDFADITRTRVMLESEAIRQAIELGDETWECNLLTAFHRLSKAEEKLDDAAGRLEWEERNRAFHEALIAASPSAWLKRFLAILHHQAERYRHLALCLRPLPRDVHAEHEALFQAAMARDGARATAIIAEHINLTFRSLQTLSLDQLDTPDPSTH